MESSSAPERQVVWSGIKGKRPAWIENGIGYLDLGRGRVALVDPDPQLLRRLTEWNWGAWQVGPGNWYVARRVKRIDLNATIYLHAELCPCPENCSVDHRDGDPFNNRSANLRPATKREQMANTRPRGATGVKFVQRRESGRFAVIYKGLSRGTFDTLEEAAVVARALDLELHGEFAYAARAAAERFREHAERQREERRSWPYGVIALREKL